MKKTARILLSVLMGSLLFSGCAKKSGDRVTVEIWHTFGGAQAAALEDAAARFNGSQSQYEVKPMLQSLQGFADSVYNAVANGIGPSIIFNYGSTAVDYAKEGLAVDIRAYMQEDAKKGDTSMQDVIDSLPEAMKTDVMGFADGGIYYLPGCTTGPVLFYNKTIYDELGLVPPATWDELVANCKTIYEKKGIPGYHADGLVDIIQSRIMQNSLGYIDVEARKVTFGTEKLAEIYDWFAENSRKGYFQFNLIGQYASEDLANGQVAAFSGSCVNDQWIQMVDGELGIAPLVPEENGVYFYTAWNRGPIFLRHSDAADRGAYEFIKFFLQPANNGAWAKANSAIAPYGTTESDADYQEYISNLPATSALPCVYANLPYSGSFPNVPGSAQVRRLLEEYLNNVVDGRMDARTAVAELEEACNKALND